mmetsp:Transcript_23818/g.27407  ORF Transcript_23818/g.27407 Transcript_23818/m.27407 type:complete len:94 (-) Transcript_23818:839-1120(-)
MKLIDLDSHSIANKELLNNLQKMYTNNKTRQVFTEFPGGYKEKVDINETCNNNTITLDRAEDAIPMFSAELFDEMILYFDSKIKDVVLNLGPF